MCYLQPMHHSMPGANHHHIHTQLFSRIVCHIIIWWYIGAILAAPHRGAKGCHPPCRRWSIDVLFSTHASQFSVNSFKPSQRPWDVSGQLEFVCPRHPQRHKFRMLDKGLTFILLAYWEGAVLSSLYIGRTSPASPCRLNLFLSPRKSHTIGGPSTIHWPVDCYPICRCPIPPPNPPPRPRPICLISPGQREKSSRERRIARDFENALRSNGYRSIGTSDRFHNWYLIYFAIYIRKCFFSMHVKQKYTRKATVIKGTRRRFSSWEKKCCFSQ